MAKVTVRDVGRLAGVHPSTVSRVLNRAFDQHTYNPETVRRIEASAAKLGYRPSHAARSLRTGKTMQIGVVVTDIANSFFGQIAARIEHHARQQGYRTLICNTEEDPQLQAAHLKELASRDVDGIILCPTNTAGCDYVLQLKVPLVSLDRKLDLPGVPHVGLNNARAGEMLGQHLKTHGYERVGVVMPDLPYDTTLTERLNGVLRGIGPKGQLAWTEIVPADQLHRQTSQHLAERLTSQPLPQAIVGLTNESTCAAINALRDCDMPIANPVGIAGIDDFSAAPMLAPAITVVAQPVQQIAEKGTACLLDLLTDKEPANEVMLLEPILIARGSLGDV